jgi:hypothetical protein
VQIERRHFGGSDLVSNTSSSTLSLDDLRLLHHWTVKTSYFHSSSIGYNSSIWSVDIVEVAFEYPFLLHGLLAIAAMHKSVEAPQYGRATLLAQADAHMSECLGPYKINLEQPTLDTSLPMFLLSTILVTYNLASAQVEEPESPVHTLLHCFRLLRGVTIVIGPFWEELTNSPIVSSIIAGITSADTRPSTGGGEISEVLQLKPLATQLDTLDAEACMEAINDLHQAFVDTDNCPNEENKHSVCMRWWVRNNYVDIFSLITLVGHQNWTNDIWKWFRHKIPSPQLSWPISLYCWPELDMHGG